MTEFFEAGSLADSNAIAWTEIEKLTFFEQVCSGQARTLTRRYP